MHKRLLELVILSLGTALVVLACEEREVDVVGEPGILRPPQTPPDPAIERWDYVGDAQQKLEVYERRIAALEAKLDELPAEARADARVTLDELERQRELAWERVEAIKKASAATWEELKPEADLAFDRLEAAYERLLRRLEPDAPL